MKTITASTPRERFLAARAFLATATFAIVAGGLVAGIIAHAPSRTLVWMVAYLVLVAGVAQAILGLGQAWLPARLPAAGWRQGQWWLFNLGNAGVIVGTLCQAPLCVAAGTALFVLALVGFLLGVRGASARGDWLLKTFRVVLVLVCAGALTGLVLTFTGLSH